MTLLYRLAVVFTLAAWLVGPAAATEERSLWSLFQTTLMSGQPANSGKTNAMLDVLGFPADDGGARVLRRALKQDGKWKWVRSVLTRRSPQGGRPEIFFTHADGERSYIYAATASGVLLKAIEATKGKVIELEPDDARSRFDAESGYWLHGAWEKCRTLPQTS